MTKRLKMIQELHQNSLPLILNTVTQLNEREWQDEMETQKRAYVVKHMKEGCNDSGCVLKGAMNPMFLNLFLVGCIPMILK